MTLNQHGLMVVATVRVIEGARVAGARWIRPSPDEPRDSGFSVWCAADDDLGDLSDLELEAQLKAVCVHCLIEAHPEAGVLLDRARSVVDGIALADE